MEFKNIINSIYNTLKTNNLRTKSEYITEQEAILIFAPDVKLKPLFDHTNQLKNIETVTSRDAQMTVVEIYPK